MVCEVLWIGSHSTKYEENLTNSKYFILFHEELYCLLNVKRTLIAGENAYSALRVVFEYNVKRFKGGSLGAINGMRPNGIPDHTCLQSLEVWTGKSSIKNYIIHFPNNSLVPSVKQSQQCL